MWTSGVTSSAHPHSAVSDAHMVVDSQAIGPVDSAAAPVDSAATPAVHPCVRRFGSCMYGDACIFARVPADVCVFFLRKKCRNGDSCADRHLTEQEMYQYFGDRGFVDSMQESGGPAVCPPFPLGPPPMQVRVGAPLAGLFPGGGAPAGLPITPGDPDEAAYVQYLRSIPNPWLEPE